MQLSEFAKEPWLQHLLDIPRWTATCTDKNDARYYKAPVNLPYLLQTGILYGATDINGITPHMTLREIISHPMLQKLPCIALSMTQTGTPGDFVILDIEAECPEDIRNGLLRLPWLYGERSMSGKGFHLVFPSPKTHPEILETKPAVKEGKIYEILLGRNHHVTFTMDIIERPAGPVRPLSDFYAIWDDLASRKKATVQTQVDTSDLPDLNDIPDAPLILSFMDSAGDYKRDPSEFDTMSEWEFGFIGYYKFRLMKVIRSVAGLQKAQNFSNPDWMPHEYTVQEQMVLLYHIVKSRIPHRDKHDTVRNNLPLLLWYCERILTITEKEETGGDET